MRNSPPISKRCSVVLRSWTIPNRKRCSADECVRLRCRDVPSRRPQKFPEHPLSFECEAPRFGDSKDAPFSHQILAGLRHQVPAGVRCCVSLQPTLRCDHVREPHGVQSGLALEKPDRATARSFIGVERPRPKPTVRLCFLHGSRHRRTESSSTKPRRSVSAPPRRHTTLLHRHALPPTFAILKRRRPHFHRPGDDTDAVRINGYQPRVSCDSVERHGHPYNLPRTPRAVHCRQRPDGSHGMSHTPRPSTGVTSWAPTQRDRLRRNVPK